VRSLETHLRSLREHGRKALVPYFMAGVTEDWTRHVEAAVLGGADAVEIGIPFSDPMMDGVVIQEAARRSLRAGTTLDSLLAELAALAPGVPLIAMTYFNIFFHQGLAASAGMLKAAGVSGAIVPDLTLEEAGAWRAACDEADVATIFLVAPSTSASRAAPLVAASQGFVYASARMAVTGHAASIGDGQRVAAMVRGMCDTPVYVGIGITTAEQAREASRHADGVIVGSAIVKRILEGAQPRDTEEMVRSFRALL
jgi:tryptophan synthase alpha chain